MAYDSSVTRFFGSELEMFAFSTTKYYRKLYSKLIAKGWHKLNSKIHIVLFFLG